MTISNGATIGFAMETTDQADAWHAAGLAAGGTAIEDPPGWREGSTGKMYLAYLRDPDGNKLWRPVPRIVHARDDPRLRLGASVFCKPNKQSRLACSRFDDGAESRADGAAERIRKR